MEHSKWAAARSVVAGRLINCYAWNDWLLALLYRSKSYEIGVAGLYPIHLQHASSSTAATTATAAPASSGTAHHFENSAAAKVAGVKGMKEIAVNNSEQGDAGDKKITKNECFHCKEEVDDAAATGTEAVTTEAEGNLPGGVEARHIKRRLHHCSAHEVENFDVSHLISSHSDYPNVLPAIITLLNL